MKPKKNDVLHLKTEDMTDLGFGVARVGGMVIFIAGCVPGDEIEGKIIKVNSSFAVARAERWTVRSPLRVGDRCPNVACRSCAYKEIAYAEELRRKESGVREDLRKAGLPDVDVLPIVASPAVCRYRNKAQYPIARLPDGGYRIGFFAPRTHRVTEAANCPLAPQVFGEILEQLRAFFAEKQLSVYDEESGQGLLRHLYLRRGEVSGRILLTLVVNGDAIPDEGELCDRLTAKFPDISGILLNVNREKTNVILGNTFRTLYGDAALTDTLAGVELRIGAASFYQVNHDCAELLYAKAKELAAPQGDEILLDLFCGVGSIGLSMARDVREVIGVEIVAEAVACAKENAEKNGLTNAKFYTGDASEVENLLQSAERERGERILPDIVILDPPRAGCGEKLIRYVSSLSPRRVVYISCNPKTLARDAALFCALGYGIGAVAPFDMFPATGHVETVVLLRRKNIDDQLEFV